MPFPVHAEVRQKSDRLKDVLKPLGRDMHQLDMQILSALFDPAGMRGPDMKMIITSGRSSASFSQSNV